MKSKTSAGAKKSKIAKSNANKSNVNAKSTEQKSYNGVILTDEQKFLADMRATNIGYAITLAITAAIAIGGIIGAIYFRVSFGFAMIVLSSVTYLAIVVNLLYMCLGISYRGFQGQMTITELFGKNREVIYIPDRLILLTVTEISGDAFNHESSKKIRKIYLPKTLSLIGENAFSELTALTDLYFEGTEAQWAEISRLAPHEGVTVHYGEPIPKPPKRQKPQRVKKQKTRKGKRASKDSLKAEQSSAE